MSETVHAMYKRILNETYPEASKPRDPLEESLSAIRDAITGRDRHFDALHERLRLGFEAQYAILKANQMLLQELIKRQHEQQSQMDKLWVPAGLSQMGDRLATFEAALKALGAQLEQIKVKQESTNFITTSINNILARRLPEKQAGAGRKKAKR